MADWLPGEGALRTPARHHGYAPIEDYAVIGNKRSAALVALDGSIDWLCLPRFDSPSVFGALLDPRMGSWTLCPAEPFRAARRYVEGTNVLETVFQTDAGRVRVTDSMTRGAARPIDWNELVRRVECLDGEVRMRWRVAPRFDFSGMPPQDVEAAGSGFVFRAGALSLTVHAWEAGEIEVHEGGVGAGLTLAKKDEALFVLASFHDRPIVLPDRSDAQRRIDDTIEFWKGWSSGVQFDGPWRDAIVRSALALELMVHEPDASMIAAVTTSLPERVAGDKNWDYRYCWIRDTTFAMDSLVRIGYPDGVHGMLTWLLHTARRTHPRVHTFYGLDGRVHDQAEVLADWDGYRGSRPVRVGNDAGSQLQLGNFGDILQTTWLFLRAGNRLDPASARQLAEVADLLCDLWLNEDSCIWELDDCRHYTQSKMAAWLCLHRALQLAADGQIPDDHVERWRVEADALRRFIEEECLDAGVWKRAAGDQGLDAAVLLVAGMDFVPMDDPRLHATIDAVRAELGEGPLLYRYSGMAQEEGAFLACSFWLVEALARTGRTDEARALMDELLPLSNDVGLYSEMCDPATGAMLGNFPQALTHLSLISAAFAVEHAQG